MFFCVPKVEEKREIVYNTVEVKKMLNISDANITFQLENLKVRVMHINYGVFYQPFPKHSHGANFYEAHLVVSGSGTLVADGESYPLKGGTLYMTGPFVSHEQITQPDDPMDEYCIQFELSDNKGIKQGKSAELLKDTHFWIGEDKQNMRLLFELLTLEEEQKNIGYIQSVVNLSSLILLALARNYDGCRQNAEYVPLTPDDKRMVIVDNSFLYDYETLTLMELARRLNLSSRQTERFLKKSYGKTFTQLKKEMRQNQSF